MIPIVFWSQTGNTEAMANEIKNNLSDAEIFSVDNITVEKIKDFDKIILGCPAMGAENLEEGEFEPFFSELEKHLNGKKIALFGSFDWGDGQWMNDWESRVKNANGLLYNSGLTINQADINDLSDCIEFAKGFEQF